MNKCSKCGTPSMSDITVFTETNFGHGDSIIKIYVKCKKCGNQSTEIEDWNKGDNSVNWHLAIDNWNKENKE